MTVAEAITNLGAPSAPELISLLDETAMAATGLRDRAIAAVAAKVSSGGKLDNAALEREQHACHGLAWLATYVEGIKQMASYAKRLSEAHASARLKPFSRRSALANTRRRSRRHPHEPVRDHPLLRSRS